MMMFAVCCLQRLGKRRRVVVRASDTEPDTTRQWIPLVSGQNHAPALQMTYGVPCALIFGIFFAKNKNRVSAIYLNLTTRRSSTCQIRAE